MSHPKLRGTRFSRLAFVRKQGATLPLIALAAALAFLPACSIDAHDKDKNGDARVDIKSPIGDLHVSEDADIRDAGLSVYPGAKAAPKDGSDDKKSANVNLAIHGFSLKVVAAEFISNDAPDKLIAYYDKELHKYGKPIQCHGEWNRGDVDSSPDKEEGSKPVSCKGNSSGSSVELKVGTEANQHIVAIKPNGGGTRFALVYVRMHTNSDNNI